MSLISALLLASLASATEIYRHVDSHGNIGFSDQPRANAERVDITPISNRYRFQVRRVHDGDTVILGNGESVRLLNINAPEVESGVSVAEPQGQAARDWLRQQIGNGPVWLRFDVERRDKYDRRLAHVFLENDRHLNLELLQQGLASLTIHPPNLLYADAMQQAEQQAKAAKIGIWNGQDYPLRQAKSELPTSERRGWQRWRITVDSIRETRNDIWLMAGDNLSLRISKQNRHLFADLNSYLGRQLEVTGWLSRRGNEAFILVRHPSVITSSD
ncbi:nuclease-like protein [Methylophaga frappieri]|uniref:Nuclease-like protein n=1 Tax=Methylophaga frappieri (strain ATCC BAA-2434 / DSM 25690 / JAM7) TaxID=754477 RepID=I1YHS7_METFJ|nr:thermonuclease family protein [Methylophaga frappieri]AFJ02470.1 nuclease-like protein [Methylophaga frappieri]